MAIGPTIDPAEVGTTGLLWLFLSYGYALYVAADLIGEGSELLLLVPSMAGLVGGVVLPLLGAVPDGAIILFSGLGSLEVAQESLSVGIGALAGSTIMLLTIPWSLAVIAGRVDIVDGKIATYKKTPKLRPGLSFEETLTETGVSLSDKIRDGGIMMAWTTLPFFLIQVPALFMKGTTAEIAQGEHYWSLAALIICVAGLVGYMQIQLKHSNEGQDKDKRIAIAKKTLQEGKMSLKGTIKSTIVSIESKSRTSHINYGATEMSKLVPADISTTLKDLLRDAFIAYDTDGNGYLEKSEIRVFLKDFHENADEEEVNAILKRIDVNSDNLISLDEFVVLCYHLIMYDAEKVESKHDGDLTKIGQSVSHMVFNVSEDDEEDEAEEVPEDFCDLTPEEQQAAIKLRAFKMLAMGTVLVVYFSDPMVDVMQEIAVRGGISPFYVSFVLAPLASNSSEVLASVYYAKKKTRKTMTVALSTLEGAACMNNTFCLCIFMGLIYFRGLAWQYTSETAAIVIVQFIMAYLVQKPVMTTKMALVVLAIFPASLIFVALLEALGFD